MSTNKKSKRSLITCFIWLVIFTAFTFLAYPLAELTRTLLYNYADVVYANESLRIHYIDVGQGDAIAINLPDNKIMLIDAGTKYSSTKLINYLDDFVLFKNFGNVIDYFVITHSDADHTGGAAKVLDKYEVKNIFRPKIYCELDPEYTKSDVKKINTDTYKATISASMSEVTGGSVMREFTDGYEIKGINYKITFMAPPLLVGGIPKRVYTSTNEYSPYIKIEHKDKSFLFTGDAYITNEEALIRDYVGSIDIDVLKVGHHGSSTSTSKEFLLATSPSTAIISVGKNSYGHPSEITLSNILHSGVRMEKILTTQNLGNIMYVLGDGYELSYKSGEYILCYEISYIYFLLGFGTGMIIMSISICRKMSKISSKSKR